MREIKYTSKFKRLYKKLDISLRIKTKKTISDLIIEPFLPKLKVHKLSGKLYPYYSCSIDYKNRIIFELLDDNSILLILVGSHSIYK